ncbi:MAG: DUF433 domain-containing protein [Ignavibacteriae bacterium]|nr:DUF433 domain-containing protein [Ignavibacteriota bacterium]
MSPVNVIELPLLLDEDHVLRVGKTRVTFDSIIQAFTDGATPEEIVQRFPSVSLADSYAVIAYYLRNRTEMDSYLAQRRHKAESVRDENERRYDVTGLRSRLLARKQH